MSPTGHVLRTEVHFGEGEGVCGHDQWNGTHGAPHRVRESRPTPRSKRERAAPHDPMHPCRQVVPPHEHGHHVLHGGDSTDFGLANVLQGSRPMGHAGAEV